MKPRSGDSSVWSSLETRYDGTEFGMKMGCITRGEVGQTHDLNRLRTLLCGARVEHHSKAEVPVREKRAQAKEQPRRRTTR